LLVKNAKVLKSVSAIAESLAYRLSGQGWKSRNLLLSLKECLPIPLRGKKAYRSAKALLNLTKKMKLKIQSQLNEADDKMDAQTAQDHEVRQTIFNFKNLLSYVERMEGILTVDLRIAEKTRKSLKASKKDTIEHTLSVLLNVVNQFRGLIVELLIFEEDLEKLEAPDFDAIEKNHYKSVSCENKRTTTWNTQDLNVSKIGPCDEIVELVPTLLLQSEVVGET